MYFGLTGVKSRAAAAWISDTLVTDRRQTWRIQPTPLPDLPKGMAEEVADLAVKRIAQLKEEAAQNGIEFKLTPDLVYDLAASIRDQLLDDRREEAEQSSKRMELLIRDQFDQGGFHEAFAEFVTGLCRSKSAILKGPVAEYRRVREWKTSEDGRPVPSTGMETIPAFYNVDPFDFYPPPAGDDLSVGAVVERVRFHRSQLHSMIGRDCWVDSALRSVLDDFHNVSDLAMAGDAAQRKDDRSGTDQEAEGVFRSYVEGWDVWVRVPGKELTEYGIDKSPDGEPLDPLDDYDVNAVIVGGELVYIDFNRDPFGRRPYYVTSWAPVTGSVWGTGLPELMADLQDICNACARSLSNNMAYSSGPQTVLNDIDRLPDGEELTPPTPLKFWQFTNPRNSNGKPLEFFQPPSNAAELLGVLDSFVKMADDQTGIPAYMFGNDRVAGAGRTSSGLSMLMNAAARGLRHVILRIDAEVLRPLVRAMYDYNLAFADGIAFRNGMDIDVVPTGTVHTLMKEQLAERRMMFLQATANPIDSRLVDEVGRANMLRDIADALDIDYDPVKTKEAIAQMLAQESQAMEEQRKMEEAKVQLEIQKTQAEIALDTAETALKYAEAKTEAIEASTGGAGGGEG